MKAPSFPSERKRVEGARTGLLTCAFPATFPQARPEGLVVQWFTRSFRDGGNSLAGSLPWLWYGPQDRSAHSCGAVAEFHRLPEHPGDCRSGLRCLMQGSRCGMEQTSIPSTFIDGAAWRSQNVRSKEVYRITKKFYRAAMQEGMVTPGRLELPTRSSGNCCSIHLSYGATTQIVRSSFGKLLDSTPSALAGRGHLSYGATTRRATM